MCSKSYTEWYNPETNSFKMGPAMPVNSVHGLCTAKSVHKSDIIYMAARREPDNLRRFAFNVTSLEFTELTNEDGVEARYAACGVADFSGDDDFVVIGGGNRE